VGQRQGIAAKARNGDEAQEAFKHADAGAGGGAVEMGFRQPHPGGGEHGGAENRQQPEARPPAGESIEEATQHRRHHRRHHEGHGDIGNDARRFVSVVDVAHHGAGQHDAGRAQCLDEARGDQEFDDRRMALQAGDNEQVAAE
jgi:hypothetical protein